MLFWLDFILALPDQMSIGFVPGLPDNSDSKPGLLMIPSYWISLTILDLNASDFLLNSLHIWDLSRTCFLTDGILIGLWSLDFIQSGFRTGTHVPFYVFGIRDHSVCVYYFRSGFWDWVSCPWSSELTWGFESEPDSGVRTFVSVFSSIHISIFISV